MPPSGGIFVSSGRVSGLADSKPKVG